MQSYQKTFQAQQAMISESGGGNLIAAEEKKQDQNMIVSEIDISQKDVAMVNSADIQNVGTTAIASDPEQIADIVVAEKSPLNI